MPHLVFSQICQLIKPTRGNLNEMYVQVLLQQGVLPRALGSLLTEYFNHAVRPSIKRGDETTARNRAIALLENKIRFEVM